MNTIMGLLAGIGTGVFSTWFPGMLNMQAVSAAVRGGRAQGYRFAFGMALVFPVQAGISIFFANWLGKHPLIISKLENLAVYLLVIIGGVFIVKGLTARRRRKLAIEKPYNGGPIKRGIGISFLNVMNIPLFLALSGWLIANGYLPNEPIPKLVYVFAVGLGALGVFLIYARLADWFARNAAGLTRNINFLIGGLLLAVAVIQITKG